MPAGKSYRWYVAFTVRDGLVTVSRPVCRRVVRFKTWAAAAAYAKLLRADGGFRGVKVGRVR